MSFDDCKKEFSTESDFRERYIIQKTSIRIKKQEMRESYTTESDVPQKVSNYLTFFCCLKNQKNVDVQKFQSANSVKQNSGLKEIPKKDKPAAPPEEEDEEMFVNESVINRIKKLINKMEYL